MWAAGLHLQPLSGVSGVQSFRHWLFLPRVSEDATRSPAATLTGRGLLSAQCSVLSAHERSSQERKVVVPKVGLDCRVRLLAADNPANAVLETV